MTFFLDLTRYLNISSGDVFDELNLKESIINNILPDIMEYYCSDLNLDKNRFIPTLQAIDIVFSDENKTKYKKIRSGIEHFNKPPKSEMECINEDFWSVFKKYELSPQNIYEYPRDESERIRVYSLGSFSPSNTLNKVGTITLYTKAVAEFCENRYDYSTVFMAILAREAFKAFYYHAFQILGKTDRWVLLDAKERIQIVKESLASYYECELIKKCGNIVPNMANKYIRDLEDDWRRMDIDSWPASGAILISHNFVPGVSPDILFRISIYDWKTASDILETGYHLCNDIINRTLRL